MRRTSPIQAPCEQAAAAGRAAAGYKGISGILRKEILDGKYDADKVLPSEWQLARRFGVCRPTASRAVLELAREGLVVRRQGAPTRLTRFAQNASGALGLVVQGEWNYEDVYPAICRRLMALAEHLGWRSIRCGLARSNGRMRLRAISEIVERLAAERVAGVFFQPVECLHDAARFNKKVVASLRAAGIHVVLLDYDIAPAPERSACDLVGVDNFSAGYELGLHLAARGARRTVFLGRRFHAPSVAARAHGLAAALRAAGLPWDGAAATPCNPKSVSDVRDLLRAFRPDAIVAYNDVAAIHLLQTLSALKKKVPRDLMLASFDDIPSASSSLPPVTTMRQPADDLAVVAFHTLVERIKNPSLPPRMTLLPCRLVARESTARR